MKFLWQGLNRFGQQDKTVHRQRQFVGLGPEEAPGETDDITQVQLFEEGIGLSPYFLTLNVTL
jgi:hypothetical protein